MGSTFRRDMFYKVMLSETRAYMPDNTYNVQYKCAKRNMFMDIYFRGITYLLSSKDVKYTVKHCKIM